MVWIIAPQYQALMPRERWQPRDRPLHFMEVEGTAQRSRMILRLRVLQLIPPYVRSELSLPDSREGFAAGSDLKGTPHPGVSQTCCEWREGRLYLGFINSFGQDSSCPRPYACWLPRVPCFSNWSISQSSAPALGANKQSSPGRLVRRNLCFFKLSGWAQDEAAMVWKFPSLSKPRGCNPHLGW